MHRSSNDRITMLLAFLCLSNISLFSQTITFQVPDSDEFYVCGTAPFEVTVTNNSGAALQGVTAEIVFTTNNNTDCGLAYVPGTVSSAASESDISDLSAPVFALADLAVGAAVTFSIEVDAPCSVIDCIDNAEIFANDINLTFNGGSTSKTTDFYEVNRALLVITNIKNGFMSGSQSNSLVREITVVNTRPGALQEFIFTDSHQGGISITAAQGTDISPGGNVFQLQFDASDFILIGDGDGFFEFNETMVIREFIRIVDCGIDVSSTVSEIVVGWGCGNETCQQVSKNAIIDIEPSDKEPNLIWEPITSFAECFCGPNGYQQGMKITNVGTGGATNLVFSEKNLFAVDSWTDVESIVVDSAGTLLDITPGVNQQTTLAGVCDGTDNIVTQGFTLTIPRLGPSQTVTIFWDLYFCDQICNQPAVDWEYRWSYFKECPPSPYVEQPTFIYVFDSGVQMMAQLAQEGSFTVQDGDTITINYELNYDSLTLLNDELVLQFNLPCGATWASYNDLLLLGQAPISIVQEQDTAFNFVTATYQLPLTNNTATTSFDFIFSCDDLCIGQGFCEDSLASSCNLLPCAPPPPPRFSINSFSTVQRCAGYPLGCNIQTCNVATVFYNCPIDSVCINEPPGYAIFDFEAARANYGLPDNDNDRLPDGSGAINLSLVRRDRLIAGDTIHARLASEVRIDKTGATLPFGFVQIQFNTAGMNLVNLGNLLTDETGISDENISIRIFDKSTNTNYTCNNPVPEIDDQFSLTYRYDLSATALVGCLPAGFAFDQGDSIIFEGNYKIRYNLLREGPPSQSPMSGFLSMQPAVLLFDADTSRYEPISCACQARNFEISAYEYTILPGIFGLPLCDLSEFVGGSLFRLEMSEPNFFPFEHRTLIYADDWRVDIPDEIMITEAKMTFLRYQGGDVIQTNQTLDINIENGEYVFDFGQFQNPTIDEAFSALFQFIFKTECDVQGSRPMTITSHLDFLDCMPEADDPLTYEVTANTLQALTPKLEVLAFNFDLTSFNNQLEFDFQLGNNRTMAGAQSSDIAPNAWLYITSATGLVTDFQLIDPTTGTAIPSVNGVFQIGDFPVDTVAYRLLGTNNSCEKEAFTIHYGWNCAPFTSQVQKPCYVRERVVNITSPPGEIDFLVDSPSGCFDLCETIPPYSLEIFNGELGSVYALTANAQMPPGQTIVPGSSQVEYPTGSGNFFPIADPVLITSTLAEWDLSAFDSLANGLPGINAAPANSITLIFETTTECGFIADAFTLFTIGAEQNCGDASNRVAKAADPICINGISQPYSTNIDVETETDFGCADEMVFEFSMTATATLSAGACVIVTLPQGISYVPNSCNSVCQNNFNCTPTVDGNTYTWQLPEGVASNQIVCFTFNTSGWSALGCEEGLVIFRTANETQALCAETGDLCDTKVNTGSQLFQYNIERPAFELDNFAVSASQTSGNDQVDFSIDIINCGSQNEPPITIDFFLDTNGDGMGDQLVHSQNLVAILSNCQSETMTGSFALPSGNLCNLVAYINPDQCACSIDSAYISVPITYQTDQSYTVCSGETKDIGVTGMTGFTYQWEPADCLGNDNAATTTFSCVNNTPSPITYQFTLAESDGDACIINNLLDVTVQPVPGIAFAQTPICAGEPTNLFATDGVSFEWQGPGITDPTTQAQVVVPMTTSTYSVTVMDEFDCVGTDSVVIEVNGLPLVDAGPDIFNCPGTATQLNATFNPAWDYLWSPAVISGLPTLSDPTIHNPNVITTEDVTYTLLVTDENGCTATDQIFVSVSGALNLIISPDITICLSSSTTLGVSGGDTYSWSGGDCLSPLCDSISVSPTVPTTYTVVASTMAGCLDSAMVTVTPTVENILTYDTLYRCAGDSALIHGLYQFESGIYVDTIVLAGGCLGIDSVTLFVSAPPETVMVEGRICEGESFEFNGNFYTESGTDTLPTVGGCDSIIYQINIEISMPSVEIQGDHTVSPDSSVTLSIEPTTFDSIVWSTENMVLECDNSTLCEVFPTESIEYTVTVVDSLGCIAIDTHQVDVVIQCFPDQAQIPNVFTPNNDSMNDVFTIVTKNDEQVLQMRIWDRWGKKVYDGTGPWDGTVNGKPAASDVYIYDILVGCPAGVEADENLLRGDVTLLR